MPLPVTIYRSTDVGAPVGLPMYPSDWIEILKACLVDGYGTKLPLGWTLEFEDVGAYKAAFRSSLVDGSGGYFRVSSYDGNNNLGGDIDLKCASEMSDINTFIKAGGARRLNVGSSSTYTGGWTVIGTSIGFWIIHESSQPTGSLNSTYATYQNAFFIGDVESYIPNDAGVFTLISAISGFDDNGGVGYSQFIGSTTYVLCTLYDTDGGTGKAQYEIPGLQYWTSTTYDGGDAEVLGLPIILNKTMLINTNGETTSGSVSLPFVRCSPPGLYLCGFVGYRTASFPLIKTINGDDYYVIRGNYTPFLWIKCSGEWYV
ncbi:hypothetical protein [Shewanella psychrotolerans]|uniref:hypothetical protein n=1 Tax=Shewanella psychrotolerans TaxID=2864206 RepID=UPI001C6587D0|nr:hypothetical protein [Shewanella psychrotolerans]QYK02803.1 hypothetical protein K0I62_07650 [Shewanella psychrotolerans]